MSIINQVRIDQTRREFVSLRKGIDDWAEVRRGADKEKQQHHTQLTTLQLVLTSALGKIETGLGGVKPFSKDHEVYAACRVFDRRVVWVRRLWEYYRVKFDQRDDKSLIGDDSLHDGVSLKDVLAAADEVVWSCYSEIFRHAKDQDASIERGTAPLPYIDLHYSPHAIPRVESPPDLKSDVDAPFLQDFLKQLPIPIIGLPAVCLQSSWSLVYLGHEVGHHVLYDLLPDLGLQTLFETCLSETVLNASSNDEIAAERWQAWGGEIFADLFSILCMGPWALWAMAELELADERTMFRSKPRYPSPVVRLALMAAISEGLKLKNTQALKNLSLEKMAGAAQADKSEEGQETSADLQLVPKVADAVTKFVAGHLGSLKNLSGWDAKEFNANGLVDKLATELRELAATPLLDLRGARLYTGSAVAAWVNVTSEWAEAEKADAQKVPDSEERQKQRKALSKHVLSVISQSREEATRSAEKTPPTDALETLGMQLGELLMQTDPGAF